MKSTVSFALMIVAVMLSGCSMTRQSPREAFLSRTPDRTNYFRCYEVSLESLRAEEDRIVRLTKSFTQSVREATTNCPACPALQERLARIETVADKLHQPHNEFMEQLQEVYDPKIDTILYFQYWAEERQEAGYLVMHDGVVKRRFAFGEESHE